MSLRCYMRLYCKNIIHIGHVAKETRQKMDDLVSLPSPFSEAGGDRERR